MTLVTAKRAYYGGYRKNIIERYYSVIWETIFY